MSFSEKFPTLEANEKENEDEVIDEFAVPEEDINDSENTNKSEGEQKKSKSRTGLKVGLAGLIGFMGAGSSVHGESAEKQFSSTAKSNTEQLINKEENSQEASDIKFEIKRVKDIMTDEQLGYIVDSTGMISTSELISKLLDYSSGLIAIDKDDPEISQGAQKFAKMHRIPGSMQIYVLKDGLTAGANTYETDTGKSKDVVMRIGQVPTKFPLDVVKNIQFIFNSK